MSRHWLESGGDPRASVIKILLGATRVEAASPSRYLEAVIPLSGRRDAYVRDLVKAGEVVVGEFRCAPEERYFATAGPITRHCFVFPRTGVWIQHEHRPAFVADSTRVTLYNPRQPYERRVLDPKGDHGDWITVSDRIAREVVNRVDGDAADSPEHVFRHAFAPARPALYLARRCLHEYVRRSAEPDLLFVEETAVNLLAQLLADLYEPVAPHRRPRPQLARQHRDTIEDVRAHLNVTFCTNESLSAIADAVGTSVFHLCRLFRRGTGLTLHSYRHQLRLRNALEPLEQPDVDLLTVALDLGYSGHSHFTASFKRLFGLVPSQLRNQITERGALRPSPHR